MDNLLTPTAFEFGILPIVVFLGMAYIYFMMFSLQNNRIKKLKSVIENQKELLEAQEGLIESLNKKANAFEKLSSILEDRSSMLESKLSSINIHFNANL
jgi:uncharacterized protein (UPF0333 family)